MSSTQLSRPAISILLAESGSFTRTAFASLLVPHRNFSITARAKDAGSLVDMLSDGIEADVVLIGQEIFDKIDTGMMQALTGKFPGTKVLLFVSSFNNEYLLKAFGAGVRGCLLSTATSEEVAFALTSIAGGERYLGPEMTLGLLGKIASSQNAIRISRREQEVLALIAEGYTSREIAERLFTSPRTIEGHRKSLLDKTGTTNTATLIKAAVIHGLIG